VHRWPHLGMVEILAADGGADGVLPDPVGLEGQGSVAARFAAAIVKAKVEDMQEQGTKALPLSVSGCHVERHGTAGALFHVVQFQTSYDFAKVSRLHVDAENTQEVVDPTACTSEGVKEELLLRGVPVVLQAGNSAKVKLVFAYVYREPCPLIHWVLANSRGEQVTLISTIVSNGTEDGGQQQRSMFVFPGGPAEVYTEWAAAEACISATPAADSAKSRVQRRSPASLAPAACSTMDVLQLKALWTSMTVHERIGSMSFGRTLRDLAIRCFAAVAELNLAARRSADLGFYAGFDGLVLVPALEFVPDPGGRPDRPLGMMFGTRLALNPDVPAIVERVLSRAGSARRSVQPPAKWASLLQPLPSSWAGLEAALAALLEQRFIHLLSGIRSRARQSEEETAAAAEGEAEKVSTAERGPSRATRRRRRGNAAVVSAPAEPAAGGPEEAVAQQACEGTLPEEQPPPRAAAEGAELAEAGCEAGPHLDDAEQDEEAGQRQPSTDEDEAQDGPPKVETAVHATPAEPPLVSVESEAVETIQADGEWQRVAPRRRRRPAAQPAAADACVEPPAHPASSSSDRGAAGVQRPMPQDHTPLRRAGSHPSLAGVPEEAEEGGDVLPRIEQLLRGWQASVWIAEAGRDASAADLWQSRRNENASWRLWFLEQHRKAVGHSAGQAQATVAAGEPVLSREEPSCLICAGGCSVGRICRCQPDPWQAPLAPAVTGTSGSCPTSSSGSLSGSNVHSGSDGRSGTDQMLAECFAPPPGMDDEVDGRVYTPWRRLLRGLGPLGGFATASSHAHKAAQRRSENAAWRRWWATHQADGGFQAEQRLADLCFPPTPTSTYPGTPRGELHDGLSDFFPGGMAGPLAPAAAPQLVYLPVPLHLAPQVHQYIQQLLSLEQAAVGTAASEAPGFGLQPACGIAQASMPPLV